MQLALTHAAATPHARPCLIDREAALSDIALCRSNEMINVFVGEVARLWAAGELCDQEAQGLWEAAEARRRTLFPSGRSRPSMIPTRLIARRLPDPFPPKRPPPPRPDRRASILRRRRLASSGAMPGKIACHFTIGEQAALAVVAIEIKTEGACRMTIGEIAARAGVGVTTARNGLRAAASLGLLTIEERRRRGAPNLANVVRIVSTIWLEWVRRTSAGRRGVGERVADGGGGSGISGTTTTEFLETGEGWRSTPRMFAPRPPWRGSIEPG
jgi:hypothetical protein